MRDPSRFGRRLLLLVLLAALALGGRAWLRGDPQALPWTPLSLAQPIGPFTPLKLARLHGDFPGCRALFEDAGAPITPAPPVSAGPSCGYADGVRLGARYAPALTAACPLAAGLFLWERQVVQPAAQARLGARVARIETYGAYNCRRIDGRATGAYSEHATADAIDVAAFRLADGRRIAVSSAWRRGGAEAAFLRDVRDGACRLFGTTLSPDYNAAHSDHLHLDMAARGGWTFCR